MERKKKVLIYIVPLLLVFLFFGLVLLSGCFDSDSVPFLSLYSLREYETEAVAVASEFEYDYPEVVCFEFANELAMRLREKGWIARTQSVEVPFERCLELDSEKYAGEKYCLHEIVLVTLPIDAVSGKILTPDEFKAHKYKWHEKPPFYPCPQRTCYNAIVSTNGDWSCSYELKKNGSSCGVKKVCLNGKCVKK